MSGIWYYRRAGQTVGPVTFETLQQLAQDGHLGENDEIRTGSDPDWTVVSTVSSLCAARLTKPDTSPATPAAAIKASETDVGQRVANETDENPAWLDVLSQADDASSRARFAVVGQTEDVNYYARIDGHEQGPLSYPRVTSMLREGSLANRDQIRSGERGDWLPIEEHPAFTVITTAADDPETLPPIDVQQGTAETVCDAPAAPAIDTPAVPDALPAAEKSATGESATGDSNSPREYDQADLRAEASDDTDATTAGASDPAESTEAGATRTGSKSARPRPRRRGVSIPAWCYATRTLGITALSLVVFAAAYFLYPRQPPHPGVSGTVTLDGQPLANATMSFLPDDDQLEPAFARTDQKGNYALQQTEAVAGAVPGRYTVRITTYEPAVTESDPPVAGIPERVPTKYNIKTELAAEVEQVENNVIDFPLDSNGQIVQPREVY